MLWNHNAFVAVRNGPQEAVQHVHERAQVTVELKNDLAINGTLHSVDQYMNIKLDNVKVVNEDKFPHMVRPSNNHVVRFQFLVRLQSNRVAKVKTHAVLCSFQYATVSFEAQSCDMCTCHEMQ